MPLLTSALYHRLAHGFRGPLVGLVYDPSSTLIRPAIGWIHGQVEEGDDLPRVLLASDRYGGLEDVAFDLSDPIDAVALLVALQRMKDALMTKFDPEEVGVLRWRADLHSRVESARVHADADPIDEWHYNGGAITRWRDDVQKHMEMERHSQDAVSSDSLHPQSLLEAKQLSETAGSESHSAAGSGDNHSKMNLSPSNYVKKSPCLNSYLYSRKVVPYSIRKARTTSSTILLPMAFVHASALVSFASDLPSLHHICVNSHVLEIVEDLRAAYTQASEGATFIGVMRPSIEQVIRKSFCVIMHVVEMARSISTEPDDDSMDASGLAQVHKEATFRHQWDQLIHAIVLRCEQVDVNYDREAALAYAENPLTGNPEAVNNVYDVFSAIHPPPEDSLTSSYEQEAYNYWTQVHTAVRADRQRAEMEQEPTDGIADGLISLTITPGFSNVGVAKDVSIWRSAALGKPATLDVPHGMGPGPETKHYTHSVFAEAGTLAHVSYSSEDKTQYMNTTGSRNESIPATSTIQNLSLADTGANSDSETRPDTKRLRAHASATSAQRSLTRSDRDLHIPLFAAEFKKATKGVTVESATGQARLYLASAITFLRQFNIIDCPVFGLVTSGSTGVMTCAWRDRISAVKDVEESVKTFIRTRKTPPVVEYMSEATIIADQHGTVVDLRNPLDAINVATFIAYIVLEHAPRMRALFAHSDSRKLIMDPKEHLAEGSTSPLRIAKEMTEAGGE